MLIYLFFLGYEIFYKLWIKYKNILTIPYSLI